MAHQGHTTADRKDNTTSSMGGFAQARVSLLGLVAIVVLAAVVLLGAAIAVDRIPNGEAATLALEAPPIGGTATSSTSMGPTAIGSAWSMAPLPEPPTYVSSAVELPPLTRASSASYSPR